MRNVDRRVSRFTTVDCGWKAPAGKRRQARRHTRKHTSRISVCSWRCPLSRIPDAPTPTARHSVGGPLVAAISAIPKGRRNSSPRSTHFRPGTTKDLPPIAMGSTRTSGGRWGRGRGVGSPVQRGGDVADLPHGVSWVRWARFVLEGKVLIPRAIQGLDGARLQAQL